jgi:hypothetical protein
MNLNDIEFRLSGGTANTDPTAALGGAMATVAGGIILSQSVSTTTPITGVTITDAAGNGVGAGTLTFNYANTTLTWQPYGGTAGTAVDVSTNGDYAIQGGSNGGYLMVTIVAASLPTSNTTKSITVSNQTQKLLRNITKSESDTGLTIYRCFYIQNAHTADSAIGGKIWIDQNTPGADTISLAVGNSAKNVAETVTITAESNTPTGVDFDTANPVSETTALTLPDLDAGDYYNLWLRNTVPAGVTEAETANTWQLGFKVRV